MAKVLLIGCGFMGSTHAECYRELIKYDVEISAACDIQKKRADAVASKFRCRVYTDAEEAIKNSDCDTVDICLPTYLHTKYAILAMRAGKNVFLEKPACLMEEECRELLKVQKETGARVMVGQVVRVWDEYKFLSDAVSDKRYGNFLSGQFKRVSTRPLWTWENWLADPEKGGGMPLDFHIHDVDFVRSVFGNPDEVISVATRDKDGIIYQIYSDFNYGDVIIKIDGCWEEAKDYPFECSYRVSFEKATLEFRNNKLTVYPLEGGKLTPEFQEGDEFDINLGAYYKELRYFINTINSGEEIKISTLEDALESVKLVIKEIGEAGGLCK